MSSPIFLVSLGRAASVGTLTYTLIKPHRVLAKEMLSHFTGDGDSGQVTSLGSHQQKREQVSQIQTCIFRTWGRGADRGGWEHLPRAFGESLQLLSVFGVEPGSSWVLPLTAAVRS